MHKFLGCGGLALAFSIIRMIIIRITKTTIIEIVVILLILLILSIFLILRTLARDRRTLRVCACGWVAQFFCWFLFRIFAAN